MIPMMVVSKIQAINGVEIEEGFKMSGTCSGNSWRSVKIKGDDDDDMLRTVECLRGRLLAERVASRAAKEESDLMLKRLTELERLLAIEIKARNKAEKILRRVLKKLESLKIVTGISDVSGQTQSDVSLPSTSSSSSSGIQFPRKPRPANSTGSDGVSAYFSANSADHSINKEASWSSAESSSSVVNDEFLCQHEVTEPKQDLLEDGLIKEDATRLISISSSEVLVLCES